MMSGRGSQIRMSALVMGACLLLVLGLTIPVVSADVKQETAGGTGAQLAAGYGELAYVLPAVGSYSLPPLGMAGNGRVLDESGAAQDLHSLFAGKYVLLSFMYSSCQDVNGCPLSAHVFYKIKAALQQDAGLAEKLRLISLSFDPEHDTPEVMRLYAENFRYAGAQGDWRFLTTAAQTELRPLLAAYGQEIQREITVNGGQADTYAHLLRVFLIDPQRRIRNIYSVGFLHPDVLLNDVRTLLQEQQQAGSRLPPLRQGKEVDLLALAQNPPLGLPPAPEAFKALTEDKIQLGRMLFFDRRLSINNTFSCAMCHIPEQGFTSNEMATAVGVEGRSIRRNSPTLYNVGYASRLFHDGRDSKLEEQIWQPLMARNEMANPSVGYVLDKIRAIPGYQGLFEAAFEGQGVSMQTVGEALAAYERTLLSADSAFDRWYYGKDAQALGEDARQGFRLFTGKARCSTCHTLNEQAALFMDNQLHNTGVGYRESMGTRPAKQRVSLAPGVSVEVDQSIIESVGETPAPDLGLYEITLNPADRWKYRTAGLRNIALTAPYMHNGSFATLEEVIRFYNQGGIKNATLSPLIQPLNLSDTEVGYLQAFLNALTGSNVGTLAADALAAPVGDPVSTVPDGGRLQ